MEQQHQQQQQPPPPTSSPVRGVAAATANAALAAGTSMAVTRSTSIESHDTGSGSIGGGSAAGRGGSGSVAGAGSVGGISATGVGGGDGSTIGGNSRNNSFRTSPLTTPRQPVSVAGSVPPFPGQPTTAVAPPPWDNMSNATPTRSASPQINPQLGPTPTPTRTGDNSTSASGSTPIHSNIPPPPALVLSDSHTLSFPNQSQSLSLSLSMTKSGESLFSRGSPIGANNLAAAANNSNTSNAQGTGNTTAGSNLTASQGTTLTDSSVLLGLEELERQQADVEKRRAEKQLAEQRAAQLAQQQPQQQQLQQGGHPRHSAGLPPLAPSSGPAQFPPGMLQQLRPTSAPAGVGGGPGASSHNKDVPSQIHLLEGDDEDAHTILSSDVAPGGGGGERNKELKRVVSIEKIRGGLRRFRSWSQDALNRTSMDNPAAASSVDSTQNATLTSAEGDEHGQQNRHTISGDRTATGSSQPSMKFSKKSLNTQSISEPYLDDDELKPLIYGYLHKLGRNGHWQRRFFETNGERLTYYKSTKRTKALATLDLVKVGEITIDRTDPDECTFTIQVKNRPYYLRAEDKARCNDWVIILNRAREARMNVGNIQLVTHKLEGGGDGVALTHRSQAGSDDYAQPCIVISALRPRTRAVSNFQGEENIQNPPDLLTSNTAEEEEEQIEVTKWDDQPSPTSMQMQGVVGVVGGGGVSSPSGGGDFESMAKWQKRHSKMHGLSLRFLKWARSITNQADACRKESDVVVVPAHVVMAAQRQQALPPSAQEAASPSAGDGHQVTKHRRKPSSGLPNLMEETQQAPSTPEAETPDNSTHNRSRASTESPAFGSNYV